MTLWWVIVLQGHILAKESFKHRALEWESNPRLTLLYYDDLSFSLTSSLVLPIFLSVLGFPRYGYFSVRFLLCLCLTPCRLCDSVVSLCFSVLSSRPHVLASLCFNFVLICPVWLVSQVLVSCFAFYLYYHPAFDKQFAFCSTSLSPSGVCVWVHLLSPADRDTCKIHHPS